MKQFFYSSTRITTYQRHVNVAMQTPTQNLIVLKYKIETFSKSLIKAIICLHDSQVLFPRLFNIMQLKIKRRHYSVDKEKDTKPTLNKIVVVSIFTHEAYFRKGF